MSTQLCNSARPSIDSLRIAVLADKESAVRELVKLGHDINSRDSKGSTALIIAARMNRTRICQVLLDLGGDPFIKNFAGLDALDEAEQATAGDSAEIIASFILEHPHEITEIISQTDLVSAREEVILQNRNTGELKYISNAISSDDINPESPDVTGVPKLEFINTQFASEDIPRESLLPGGTHSIEIASTSTAPSEIDFANIRVSNNGTGQSILAHRQRINKLKERALVKEFTRFHPFKSTSELRFRNQCLSRLIELGYSKNYLLVKDILSAIPDYSLTSDMLEIVVSMLNEIGIAVYNHSSHNDISIKDIALINDEQFEKNILQSIEEARINPSLAISFENVNENPSRIAKYGRGESLKSELSASGGELAQFDQLQETKADSLEEIEALLGKVAPSLDGGFIQGFAAEEPILSNSLDARIVHSLEPLISLGRNRGYVTHSDISEFICDKPVGSDMFQKVIGFLEDMEIIVYERSPDFESMLLECIAAYSDGVSITSTEYQDVRESWNNGS